MTETELNPIEFATEVAKAALMIRLRGVVSDAFLWIAGIMTTIAIAVGIFFLVAYNSQTEAYKAQTQLVQQQNQQLCVAGKFDDLVRSLIVDSDQKKVNAVARDEAELAHFNFKQEKCSS